MSGVRARPQAQDRCHRIGQTREVHIYRLVSERTIEENILTKSDQKRRLDHLAIQSGGFNTEHILQKFNPRELLGLKGARAPASARPPAWDRPRREHAQQRGVVGQRARILVRRHRSGACARARGLRESRAALPQHG